MSWLCRIAHDWFLYGMDYDSKPRRRVCLRCGRVESVFSSSTNLNRE